VAGLVEDQVGKMKHGTGRGHAHWRTRELPGPHDQADQKTRARQT